uniref:Lipocalin/cytosolic fatty-acid binding domain-containing protein n=1 Tax=Mustela putorius furo TaxID=9669 RepID=M3YKQ1_MUSPF
MPALVPPGVGGPLGARQPAGGVLLLDRTPSPLWPFSSPPDLEENQLFVLDTDYDNYLFFCVESTSTAPPTLMCQYLARTLKVDNEVVQKFDKTLKTLPVHIRLFLNPTQVEEQCRV